MTHAEKMDRVTERARELYDQYTVGDYSYGEKRHRFDTTLKRALARLPAAAQVYDVGCGTGHYLEAFVQWGVPKSQLTGIDLAPENVRNLQARGFNALNENVLDLRVSDDVSDFTFSQGVIHHTSDPFRAFQELVRMTKPGGLVYVNLYNGWHPYFYLIHRATFPLRYAYWNWNKKVADWFFYPAALLFQPLAFLVMKEFMNMKTAKTFFMDQVMTPRAHLFTRSKLEHWATRCGCEVESVEYNRHFLMVFALLKVTK